VTLHALQNLDRRWVFLMMLLAVAIPTLMDLRFPERPSALSQAVYDRVEALPQGSRVLLALDYDPGSEGEIAPMAAALVHHCARRGAKMYFVTLWPAGTGMITQVLSRVIAADLPHLVYGRDFVNLGFQTGNEGIIKLMASDLPRTFPTDARGAPLSSLPIMEGVASLRDMDLVVALSSGNPGAKEWVQYGVSACPGDFEFVAGCTGVQAPQLYPYVPQQISGLLAAIKGAAEYEQLVFPDGSRREARRRMGPQLIAHLLMVGLIIAGNGVYFSARRAASRREASR